MKLPIHHPNKQNTFFFLFSFLALINDLYTVTLAFIHGLRITFSNSKCRETLDATATGSDVLGAASTDSKQEIQLGKIR